ncbi:MAG: DUF2911 domain-containing protein [Gemmatimonas sp.]|jgi:hypothetical protein|uniref:DUF2911 domain-containing protein n=1 Tax=Gemmatimonas sp. TaxID=1962908 RepID=UPI0025C6E005|nr:DUF2911 domain-containing protein [Gemmatimonas sp.]MCE2954715.1 DUF2911 domain-containing protein [Gemmatimonas sp.]
MTISRSLVRGAFALAAVSVFSVSATAQGGMGGMQMGGGRGQAPASPRDSLTASVSGAEIKVNYGRPSKRGRVIFNGLNDMKWGMVWRTGANEATHFTTSKALDFGGKSVPAGTYTLFTQLEANGKWELIVNKQTKQWGTAYDKAQDLVRIPMTVTDKNAVVEKMEIQVKPAGKGGEIIVMWDTYKAVAGFAVK